MLLTRHLSRWILLGSLLLSMIPTAAIVSPQPAYAQSEAPVTLANNTVSSYDVPSPGLFYHTAATCPFVGPKVAADTASSNTPDAPDAASPFYLLRTTVRGEDFRTLQRIADNSGPNVCVPHEIYSNVVADENFVYWVDKTGLVKLPVTANINDTPQLMNSAYGFELPVELLNDGDRLIAVSNLPVQSGPFGASGGSYVESVDKVTGEYTVLYRAGTFTAPENKYFHDVKTDGKYIYFVDRDRILVRLDNSGETPVIKAIGAAVESYYPEGEVTICLTIQCTTTDYVLYAQNNTIRRYNNVSGADDPVHNLPIGATVPAMVISKFLFFTDLFYFRSTYESSRGFGGTYTFALYRAGTTPGSSSELLYSYSDDNFDGPAAQPGNFKTDGTYLFWTEGLDSEMSLKRLPNDVDALPKVDMAITGMEITQGVQNNNNSVRLVKGRETYVRVFVQSLDPAANIPGATMRLYVSYNGSERGPYRPINGTHLTAKVAPDRNQLGDSFLFVLPWEASNQDQVSLRAVLNPYKVPPEPNYANNEWQSPPYTFSPGRGIDLIFVEANYCIQRTLTQCDNYSVNDTSAHVDYLRRAYPIPENGINLRVWSINGGALLGNYVTQVENTCTKMREDLRSLCASDWVNAKIGTIRANAGNSINAQTLTYGLITDSSGTGGAFPRGQAGTDRIGSGPAGTSLRGSATSLIYSDFGYYSGHEIGHMYGRAHPSPNSDDPATTTDKDGKPIVEGCGHSRSDDSFPHALALIGPGDGSIRGFDRAAPSSGGWPRPRVLDDTNAYDMMSYCGNAQLRWPSDYTWEGLYQGIINTPAQAAGVGSVALDGDFLSLFGTIYGEDVFVHSVARLSSVTATTPGDAGAWRVRLLDGSSNELAAYRFDAGDGDIAEDAGQAFGVVVPFAPGTQRYEIVNVASGEARFDAAVSANAPTVSNVALQNPPAPVDGTVTLQWQAADADGDTLSYDIFYSVDSGASYQPLLLGVSGTQAEIDTSKLAGGQGRFRVYANDSVNQGFGDSPEYTMAVKAPAVNIIQPADGARFNWDQLINFSGDALDPQDGLIQGASLAWANQNGTLGNGGQISVSDLPVGPNVITLSAQNSAGLSASKQITIYVDDPLALPGPTLTLAPSALSFQSPADSQATQDAVISLENSGGGTMTWSAASSVPWLTLAASSGDVPGTLTVTMNPAGLPNNTLQAGEITITGTATDYPDQVVTVPVGLSIGNSTVNPQGTVPDDPDNPDDPDDPNDPDDPDDPDNPGQLPVDLFMPKLSR